jgi:ribosome recycling factor
MDLNSVRQQMDKAMSLLNQEMNTIKAGRANPVIVERIMVEAYQTKMPLVELASITAPDPNYILITPYDQTILKDIAHALAVDRGLNLSSIVDNGVVRVNIPPLSEERRLEMVKLIKQKAEMARVMIRQIRHDQMADLKRDSEDKTINEDERTGDEEDLQKMTDEYNKKIDGIVEQKEKELLTV